MEQAIQRNTGFLRKMSPNILVYVVTLVVVAIFVYFIYRFILFTNYQFLFPLEQRHDCLEVYPVNLIQQLQLVLHLILNILIIIMYYHYYYYYHVLSLLLLLYNNYRYIPHVIMYNRKI